MEFYEKSMTIGFYFIFLCSVTLEIVFLFEVPYYYFSSSLQCLKIIRILLGIINILISLYFIVIKFAENLIKKEEAGEEEAQSSSNRYLLSDQILISVAFFISLFTLSYNIIGIALSAGYLKKKDSSFMANCLYVDSLLLFIENILISLCWLYFLLYWAFNIHNFLKVRKTDNNRSLNKINPSNAPPGPSHNSIPSSERQVNQ